MNEKCIKICNSLLRGERSAVETYEQALEKFAGEPQAKVLDQIRDDHRSSVTKLESSIRRMGGEPSSDSGSWGTFAQAVEGTAKLFGGSAALKALIEGEEHGRNEYEEALESRDMLQECKQMISTELLPRQQAHIAQLEQLPGS